MSLRNPKILRKSQKMLRNLQPQILELQILKTLILKLLNKNPKQLDELDAV